MNIWRVFWIWASNELYVLNALLENPDDGVCAFCQDVNDFADDCGFWYLSPLGLNGYSGPACRACYFGGIGEMHTNLYGTGER